MTIEVFSIDFLPVFHLLKRDIGSWMISFLPAPLPLWMLTTSIWSVLFYSYSSNTRSPFIKRGWKYQAKDREQELLSKRRRISFKYQTFLSRFLLSTFFLFYPFFFSFSVDFVILASSAILSSTIISCLSFLRPCFILSPTFFLLCLVSAFFLVCLLSSAASQSCGLTPFSHPVICCTEIGLVVRYGQYPIEQRISGYSLGQLQCKLLEKTKRLLVTDPSVSVAVGRSV